jgi:RNase P subunit RPR2
VTEEPNHCDGNSEFSPFRESRFDTNSDLEGSESANNSDGKSFCQSDLSGNNLCIDCGIPLSASDTRCELCRRRSIDSNKQNRVRSIRNWEFCRVVFAVIEASSKWEAVAKGSAAFGQLVNREEGRIDSCQLIHDFETEPSTFLTSRWGSLPGAVKVSSDTGERLLNCVRRRIKRDTNERVDDSITYLYTEAGMGIQLADFHREFLETTSTNVWLVPAISFAEAVSETSQQDSIKIPTAKRLNCRDCGHITLHLFEAHEAVPHGSWSKQPIWTCEVCGIPRYGPRPESDGSE